MNYECYSFDVRLDTLEILSTIRPTMPSKLCIYSIIISSDNGLPQQQQPKETERTNKLLSSLYHDNHSIRPIKFFALKFDTYNI